LALSADAVITTCDPVLLSLPDRFRHVPHLRLVNGVATAEFDSVSRPKERTGAVYVGAIDERFDWSSVIAMARAVPSESIDLYGPVIRREPETLPANLRLRGPIAHDRVPDSLVAARVGLLPFSDHPWNAGRNPIKLFEYLAAGLNVVAGGLPQLASLEVPGLHSYQTPDGAGALLAEALGRPENRPGISRALQEDWSIKADSLMAFLDRLDAAE
jgi:teichuronic acid biosynthesis glycosyltransferase TuaH